MRTGKNSRRKFLTAAGGIAAVPAGMLLGNVPAFGQDETRAGHPRNIFYDVMSAGATGDGKTIDSPAINRAIDDAAASGGGTVYLPRGKLPLLFDSPEEQSCALPRPGRDDCGRRSGNGCCARIRSGGAESGVGGLSGLRAQSLAQQLDLGRRAE